MIKLIGSISATRVCPNCNNQFLEKNDSNREPICGCGWVWVEPKVVDMSAGIQGKATIS